MDHLMPGMDGFQAVQAIKNNPRTATIPIMMYTSQEGELYLSQARALGAIGVLPKQTKHADVAKALEQLRLLGEHRARERNRCHAAGRSASGAGELAANTARPLEDTADIARRAIAAAGAGFRRRAARCAHLERRRAPRTAEPAGAVAGAARHRRVDGAAPHSRPAALRGRPRRYPGRTRGGRRAAAAQGPAAADHASHFGPPESGSSWRLLDRPRRGDALPASPAGSGSSNDSTPRRWPRSWRRRSSSSTSRACASLSPTASPDAPPPERRGRRRISRHLTVEPVPLWRNAAGGLAAGPDPGAAGAVERAGLPGRWWISAASRAVSAWSPEPARPRRWPRTQLPFARCEQVGNPREDNGSASLRQSVAFANMIAIARHNGNGKLNIQIDAGRRR